MENLKNFLCHGCMKKYKYSGDFKELIGKKCKQCGFIVWTAEEQILADKVENIKSPLQLAQIIGSLSPLERRLFQYWHVAIQAAGDTPTLNDNFMDTLTDA